MAEEGSCETRGSQRKGSKRKRVVEVRRPTFAVMNLQSKQERKKGTMFQAISGVVLRERRTASNWDGVKGF